MGIGQPFATWSGHSDVLPMPLAKPDPPSFAAHEEPKEPLKHDWQRTQMRWRFTKRSARAVEMLNTP
jgi:hypothetical protein